MGVVNAVCGEVMVDAEPGRLSPAHEAGMPEPEVDELANVYWLVFHRAWDLDAAATDHPVRVQVQLVGREGVGQYQPVASDDIIVKLRGQCDEVGSR